MSDDAPQTSEEGVARVAQLREERAALLAGGITPYVAVRVEDIDAEIAAELSAQQARLT